MGGLLYNRIIAAVLGTVMLASFPSWIVANQWEYTRQGVPVLLLQAPQSNGISVNDLPGFDIAPNGMLLNNALSAGLSRIGGAYDANPFYDQRAADVVVIQVTSPQSSRWEGPLELVGSPADVWVANPQGIWVNGASLFGATHMIMGAGQVAYPTTGMPSPLTLIPSEASVGVGERGLWMDPGMGVTMLAPRLVINGPVIGDATLTLQSIPTHLPPNPQGPHDTFQGIDLTAQGGIQARSVTMLANDTHGIRLAGPVMAHQHIRIEADGKIAYRALMASASIQVVSHTMIGAVTGYLKAPEVIITAPVFDHQSSVLGAQVATITATVLSNAYGSIGVDRALTIDSRAITNTDGTIWSDGQAQIRGLDEWVSAGTWMAQQSWQLSANRVVVTDPLVMPGSLAITATHSLLNHSLIMGQHVTLTAPTLDNTPLVRGSTQSNGEWSTLIVPTSGRIMALSQLTLSATTIRNAGVLGSDDQLMMTADTYQSVSVPMAIRPCGGCALLPAPDWDGLVMAPTVITHVSQLRLRTPSLNQPLDPRLTTSMLTGSPLLTPAPSATGNHYQYITQLGWWDGIDARYLIDQWASGGSYVLATDGPLFSHAIATQMVRLKGIRRPLGLTDDAQAQWLMDDALKVAPTMGLVLGMPLTPSQSKALTHDIVWLVSQNGMLMPQVYVAPSSSPTIPWSRQWVVDHWQGSVGSWHQHDAIRVATLNVVFNEWQQSGLMWAQMAAITVNQWVMANDWWGHNAQWAGNTAWLGGNTHLTGHLAGTFDRLSLQAATVMADGTVTLNARTMILTDSPSATGPSPFLMVGTAGVGLSTGDDLVMGYGLIRSSANVAIHAGGSVIVTPGWERGSHHEEWQGGRVHTTWEVPLPSVIMAPNVSVTAQQDMHLEGTMIMADHALRMSASGNLVLRGATRTDTTVSEWQRHDTSWWGLVKTHTWHRDHTWSQVGIPTYLKAPDIELSAGLLLASEGVIKEGDRTHETATHVVEVPMQDKEWRGSVHGSRTGIGLDWGALLTVEALDQRTDTWDERSVGNITIARDTLSKRATDQLQLIGSRLQSGGTLLLEAPTVTLRGGRTQHLTQFEETHGRLNGLGLFARTAHATWGVSLQYAITHQQKETQYETVSPTWLTADQVMIQGGTLTWGGVMIEATSDVTIRSAHRMTWESESSQTRQFEQRHGVQAEWGFGVVNRWGQLLWGGGTDALSRGCAWATWLTQVSERPREAGRFGFDWGGFASVSYEGSVRRLHETGGVGVRIQAGRDVTIDATGGLTANGAAVMAGRQLVVSDDLQLTPLQRTRHQQESHWGTSVSDGVVQDRSAGLWGGDARSDERIQEWGTWQAPVLTGSVPSSNGLVTHDTLQIQWGGQLGMGWDHTGWGIRGWGIQTPGGYDVSSGLWHQLSRVSGLMDLEKKGPMAVMRLGRALGDGVDALGWGWSHGLGEGWEDYQRKVRVRDAIWQLAPHNWSMGGIGSMGGHNALKHPPYDARPLLALVSNEMGIESPQGIRTWAQPAWDDRLAGVLLNGAWGYYDPIEHMMYVGRSASLSPIRWWETVGHELGHHVDHQQSRHPTEWRADRFATHILTALRDEWGDIPPIPWQVGEAWHGGGGLQWLPRTYVINGIGNTHGNTPPPEIRAYVSALNHQLGREEVRVTRGIYNGGLVRNVWSVVQALAGQGPYDRLIQDSIESDLTRDPLQQGETVTLIGYSGGGAVALNVAAPLSKHYPVSTVMLLGSPAPLGHRFRGTVIKVNASVMPHAVHRWDPIPLLGNPLAHIPSSRQAVWWLPVAHSGEGSYLSDPKAIGLVADQLRRQMPRP